MGLGGTLEREAALGAVTGLISRARAGRGGALFVVGEAGLGKTTVLDHARKLACPDIQKTWAPSTESRCWTQTLRQIPSAEEIFMATPAEDRLRSYATDWFGALDRHADVDSLLPLLVDEELEMHFPEGIQKGHAGFRNWYNTVTHRFFDEVHELKDFTVTRNDNASAEIHLIVNWQAKIWDPPEPRSKWLGFDATQTWELRRSPGVGDLQIIRYIVNAMDPMPGSVLL